MTKVAKLPGAPAALKRPLTCVPVTTAPAGKAACDSLNAGLYLVVPLGPFDEMAYTSYFT